MNKYISYKFQNSLRLFVLARWPKVLTILFVFVFLGVGCQPSEREEIASIKPLQPAAGVIPVRIVHTAAGYELQRGGKPYFIKGAAGIQNFDEVRAKGGNSVRLYTATYGDLLLDEAHKQGLTVMLGLWMKPAYEKFDYYDPKAVAAQQREVYRQVQLYKNHPALLMWNLGNELDNHTWDFKVFQVVNETAEMIHKLDPNHPVTTTLTDACNAIPALIRLCPAIDVLTMNVFGKLAIQPERITREGWQRPFIIGEFGGQGWWEVPQTIWGAPIDQSGSVKAVVMKRGYEASVVGKPGQCLGSYALYWGNRFEQTDMWLSMFAPTGEKTPMVDMMQTLWSHQQPENKSPRVGNIRLNNHLAADNVVLRANADYPAAVEADDPERDSLRVQWRVTRDIDEVHALPQNRTAPEAIAGAITMAAGQRAVVHTPTVPGAYRLLVNVYDGKGSVTSHSFPFFVGKLKRPTHKDEKVGFIPN